MAEDRERPVAVLPRHDERPKTPIPVEPVFYERPRPRQDAPLPRDTKAGTQDVAPPSPPPATAPRRSVLDALQRYRRSIPRVWGMFGIAMLAVIVLALVTSHSAKHATKLGPAPAAAPRTAAAPNGQAGEPSAGARATPSPRATPTTAPPPTTGLSGRTVLLDIKRDSGSKSTQHFTVPGPRWTLGWAYDCTQQGGTGSFKITILSADGTPNPDGGVDQHGAKGSSVAAYTTTGERSLSVQTTCLWAIRVTT